MQLSALFPDQKPPQVPVKLADLGYIKTERTATHEAAVLLNFVTRWMEERNFSYGLSCLKLLRELKGDEKRQDGITPSIIHELTQSLYIIALTEAGYELPDIERQTCLALMHDLGEEKGLKKKHILQWWEQHEINRKTIYKNGTFTKEATNLNWEHNTAIMIDRMAKEMDGVYRYPLLDIRKNNSTKYFLVMLEAPETVLCKLMDRIHNMATLIDVKTPEKHQAYIEETVELREILRLATERYPRYARALSVMDKILGTQIYFNSFYLNKIDPQNHELISVKDMPRLRRIAALPLGFDPLFITQQRANSRISWINAYKNPASLPS